MRFFGKPFYFVTKAVLWSFMLCLATYSAVAQDLDSESNDKPAPTPNLTLNIVLNSALDEQATQEYSKIAQEIISRLPRQIKVPSDLKNLSSNAAFDHMNVVAYFPKEDGQEADLDKLIKHFKVNFLFEGEDTAGGYAMGEVGEKGYVAVDPMATQGGINIAQRSGMNTEDDPANLAKELLEGTPKAPETEVAEKEALAEAAPKSEPSEAIAKTAEKTDEKPSKKPEREVVAQKTAPKKSVVAEKKEPKAVVSKTKPTVKEEAPELKLAFQMDDVFLNMENRRELANFAKQLRSYKGKVAGYNIMIRSYFGPNGDQTAIGRERLERIITFLRQQDVDVTAGIVTEIHVQTLKDQFVSIEPVTKGQS